MAIAEDQLSRRGNRVYPRRFCSRICQFNHWLQEHRPRVREIKRRSESRRKDYLLEYRQKNRERIQTRVREQALKKFGITSEEYDTIFALQAGRCAICNQEEALGKRLAVDHDHETGKVRGLLCMMCNTVLGKMRDDPALLRRAANYLEGRKEERVYAA